MSEPKPINIETIKSENFFSSEATEYQYVPYFKDGKASLALTFYRGDVEVDTSTIEPKLLAVRKALCTVSLDAELVKLLANQLTGVFAVQEKISENEPKSSS